MYTANILRKTVDLQLKKIYIDIAYYNGGVEPVATETHEFGIEVTLERIKQYVQNQVERFEGADTNLASITEGVLDLSSVKEEAPVPIVVDPEDELQAVWFRKWNKYQTFLQLIEAGVLVGYEIFVTNLKDSVKTTFKAKFIN